MFLQLKAWPALKLFYRALGMIAMGGKGSYGCSRRAVLDFGWRGGGLYAPSGLIWRLSIVS